MNLHAVEGDDVQNGGHNVKGDDSVLDPVHIHSTDASNNDQAGRVERSAREQDGPAAEAVDGERQDDGAEDAKPALQHAEFHGVHGVETLNEYRAILGHKRLAGEIDHEDAHQSGEGPALDSVRYIRREREKTSCNSPCCSLGGCR